MKKLYDLYIEDIWFKWVWISKLDSWKKVILNWTVLPNSIVDAIVKKNKKDYIQARVCDIKKIDKNYKTTDELCPHYFFPYKDIENDKNTWCWWCKKSIIPYEKQIQLKKNILSNTFKDIWQDDIDIIPAPFRRQYRNKVEFSFWNIQSGDKNLGFHKQWMFSKVVDVQRCYLISEKMHSVFEYLKQYFLDSSLPFYDQKKHEWFFRHLIVRYWYNTEQLMINLSVAPWYISNNLQENKKWNYLLEKLQKDEFLQKNIQSFFITYNKSLSDAIKSNESEVELLFWKESIDEQLSIWDQTVDFEYWLFSFFQTNTMAAEKLFANAFDMVWKVDWTVLDMYCWIWTIWILYAKYFGVDNLVWIESVNEAIQYANINASKNWLQNYKFWVWDTEKVLPNNSELWDSLSDVWLVFVDPPRDWLWKKTIKFLWQLKNHKNFKLVYISCNPTTMSSDILRLQKYGFELSKIRCVDMFPNTYHVESIWVLD